MSSRRGKNAGIGKPLKVALGLQDLAGKNNYRIVR
jgi:hypothetical protein